ncbi:MAG: phasin family protein [Fulvimonas sp.]|jgi:hypothetical protein|nr:phasin family protein [Fulvimonas sp.]
MAQPQLNTQLFSYARQLVESVFKAQALTLQSLEQIADLQLDALEKQSTLAGDFLAAATETRTADGLRGLWEKGMALNRDSAERAVNVAREVFAVTQRTAQSLAELAKQQQQAAKDAATVPLTEARKAAA